MGFPFDPVGAGLVYNVKSYGAFGDGVHDDTAAIQATANVASKSGNGGVVYLPPGRYAVSTTITINGQAVHFVGSGWSSPVAGASNPVSLGTSLAVLAPTSSFPQNSYVLDFNNTSNMINGCGLRYLSFDGSDASTVSNVSACHLGNAAFFDASDFSMAHMTGTGFICDQEGATYSTPSVSQLWFTNFWMQGGGGHGIWVVSGDFTTEVFVSEFWIRDGQNGIYIAGEDIGKVYIHDGGITQTNYGVWIAGYENIVHDLVIAQCYDSGIYVASGGYANYQKLIHHNIIRDSDQSVNGSADIYIASGAINTRLSGNICAGVNTPAEYGIYVADSIGSNGIAVDSDNYSFNHKTSNFYSGGAGNNYTKWTPPSSSFTLPASGTAWTNNSGADGTLYVTGAGVVTDVVVQGVTVASSLSVGQTYFVPAGGTIKFTYTTAPTLVFVGN
ncbi:MAG: glycosyl hydrolase family 28-related protein [Candidatus Dormibacteraeota bacterium]|jgi:hypothetical protein|nr:glycosyl hydrolase family 28-related protein [Candidatus Dormibacteraeota bacterium]